MKQIAQTVYCDYPVMWALGFQDPASNWMYAIIDQHDRIIFFQLIVLVVVIWFITSSFTNSDHMSDLHHGNQMEQIWTLTPAGFLWAIGLPSLRQQYMIDEIQDAEISIKIIGNQWYWSYEFNDYNDDQGQSTPIAFDSFMIAEDDLEPGQLRNLTVDNNIVLPIHTSIRLQVTSNDVNRFKFDNAKHGMSQNVNPNYVTGQIDAEGCFNINIDRSTGKKNDLSYNQSPTFSVSKRVSNPIILNELIQFFHCGNILQFHSGFLIKGSNQAFKHIQPHFEKYPQLTKKRIDYEIWSKVVRQMIDKVHLTKEGLIECLKLIVNQNQGQPKHVVKSYPNLIGSKIPMIDIPNKKISPYWLTGFTEGEGSFNCYVTDKGQHRKNMKFNPVFCQSQHSRDLSQLSFIKNQFNTGSVYTNKDMAYYTIKDFYSLKNIIIPHFKSYPFSQDSQAHMNFKDFCKIIEIMEKGQHLTKHGSNQILSIIAEMNLRRLLSLS